MSASDIGVDVGGDAEVERVDETKSVGCCRVLR